MLFKSVAHSTRLLLSIIILVPVLAGLAGAILPALGYFPALDYNTISMVSIDALLATPELVSMSVLSVSSGLIATVIAFVGSMVLLAVFYNTPTLDKLQHGMRPLLAIPHAAVAISLAFIVAPSGWAVRIISPWLTTWSLPPSWFVPNDSIGIAMTLALAIKELPFILLIALSVLSQVQFANLLRQQHQLAQTLGYSPVTAFFKVIFVPLYRQLRIPIYAVLAYASSNVEIALILGPNQPSTLAVAILHWFNDVDLSLRLKASAGAVLQLLLTLLTLAIWWLLEQGVSALFTKHLYNGKRCTMSGSLRLLAHALIVFLLGTAVITVISIVLWSVAGFWPYPHIFPDTLTMMHWQEAVKSMRQPLINSVILGVIVSIIAIACALLTLEAESGSSANSTASRWKKIDSLLYVPLIVPGVAFFYGLVWLQQSWLSHWTWTNVLLSHFLYVLPYVFISLAVSYRKLDKRYEQVAFMLGASQARIFWRIKLPTLFAPILTAFALGLAISFSQYLPTLLVGGGSIATITTEAVAIASGSSRRLTAVYVIIQVILPMLAFWLAWWLPRMFFNPQYIKQGRNE